MAVTSWLLTNAEIGAAKILDGEIGANIQKSDLDHVRERNALLRRWDRREIELRPQHPNSMKKRCEIISKEMGTEGEKIGWNAIQKALVIFRRSK